MIKEKKGYSLTVLIVTIAVILIITTTAVISIRNIDADRDVSKFMADMNEVKQFVIEYYARNNVLPITYKEGKDVSDSFLKELADNNKLYQVNALDVGKYYEVDLALLGKIHLNDKNRGYLMNEGSLNIYVQNPFEYNGEKYYTLTSDLTETDIIPMDNYKFKLNVAGIPVTWTTEAEILVSVTDLPINEGATWNFKWMEGTHTASDFSGDSVGINNFIYGDTFTIYNNGTYTVYAENPSGDFVTRNIVISKIDDIPPVIKYEDGKIVIDDPETGVAKLRCKIKENINYGISSIARSSYPEYYTMLDEEATDTNEEILEKYLWGDRKIKGDTVQNYLNEYEKYYAELTTYNTIIANSEATSGELENASKMIKQLNDSHPQFAYDNETFSNDERNLVLYVEDMNGNASVYSAITRKELANMEYVAKTENLEGSKAVINNNSGMTSSRDVKISLSSPYADYYFITETRNASPSWKPFESRIVDYKLSDGDGEKIVYVFFKDANENVKSTAQKITLDTNLIYAYLTDKNTLVLTSIDKYDTGDSYGTGETIVKCYKADTGINVGGTRSWNNEAASIEKVVIEDEIQPTSMARWFFGCGELETIIGLNKVNTSKVTSLYGLFTNCTKLEEIDVSNFNTSNVTQLGDTFYGCSSLKELDISNFDTRNVTNMYRTFCGCSELEELNLGNINTEKVENMHGLFQGCKKLNSINVSSFNTQNVTTMSQMFFGCSALESIDLSNFNTEKVENMRYMFPGCSSLVTLDLGPFNTQNVTDMQYMFHSCSNLEEINLSSFNTSKVTNVRNIFCSCPKLKSLDLSSWDTSSIENMAQMFYDCKELEKIYVSDKFDTSAVTDSTSMFWNCYVLTGGNGTQYKQTLPHEKIYARIDGGPDSDTPGYFTYKAN